MQRQLPSVFLLPLLLAVPAACSQHTSLPLAPAAPDLSRHPMVPVQLYPGPPQNPNGLVLVGNEFYLTTSNGGSRGRGAIVAVNLSGKARTVYNIRNGLSPQAIVLPLNGELYATTPKGGENRIGTIFAVDAATGALKFSYSFKPTNDGAMPFAPLSNVNGVLYGTTRVGGTGQLGTIFKVTPSGRETMLYGFKGGSDGALPDSGSELTYHNGVFYGATPYGGGQGIGCGTVYKFDPATGTETPIYRFQCGNDGDAPESGILFVNGMMYGVASEAGAYNGGTLYRIDPSTGQETTLHSFGATKNDGMIPNGAVIDVNGVLYGVTFAGGPIGNGTVYSFNLSTQKERVLHSFVTFGDGTAPDAPMIRVGNVFYGTTLSGGANQRGTIFKIDTSGNESIFYSF